VAGRTVGARDRYFEVSHFRQSRCVRVNSSDDLVGRVGTSISENANWLYSLTKLPARIAAQLIPSRPA
jgi:hypothetical protein